MNTATQEKMDRLEQLVSESAVIARETAKQLTNFELKATDDPVTVLDRELEKKFLEDTQLDANHIGEEYGQVHRNKEYTVLVDPIDGTKDMLRKGYNTAIAVALRQKDKLVGSIIHDIARNITYIANEKEFLRKEGETVSALPQKRLFERASIITEDRTGKETALFLQNGYAVRRPGGGIALELAQVAAGIYDGIYLDPYEKDGLEDTCDMLAGIYQLERAGINLYTSQGKALNNYDTRNGLIAMHPSIEEGILKVLKNARQES